MAGIPEAGYCRRSPLITLVPADNPLQGGATAASLGMRLSTRNAAFEPSSRVGRVVRRDRSDVLARLPVSPVEGVREEGPMLGERVGTKPGGSPLPGGLAANNRIRGGKVVELLQWNEFTPNKSRVRARRVLVLDDDVLNTRTEIAVNGIRG